MKEGYYFPYPIESLMDIFRNEKYLFLLHSSQGTQTRGRFSILGFDPYEVVRGRGKAAFQIFKEKFRLYQKNVFSKVADNAQDNPHQLPFFSGAVGYLGYDLGLDWQGISSGASRDVALDDFSFGFYDCVLVFDHVLNRFWIQSSGLPEKETCRQRARAVSRKQYVLEKILKAESEVFFPLWEKENRGQTAGRFKNLVDLGRGCCESVISNFSKKGYLHAVEKALSYIQRGDIYQVNLSQRFQMKIPRDFDPILSYQLLAALSPADFGGYLDCGEFQLMSSSPERFLSVRDRRVETRPMKGTRPRGRDSHHDKYFLQELIVSEKEKAELLMVTDLLRNDLGRVCAYGSVRIKELRHIEQYRTVFQAVSEIEGILLEDKDVFDLLEASFPGGSITGCPKIRAMQIIDELEPTARTIYTGSLGYIDFSGNMDFNILIRTLVHYRNMLYFQVGGGIVFDSIPEREYAETLVKAGAINECLSQLFQPMVI